MWADGLNCDRIRMARLLAPHRPEISLYLALVSRRLPLTDYVSILHDAGRPSAEIHLCKNEDDFPVAEVSQGWHELMQQLSPHLNFMPSLLGPQTCFWRYLAVTRATRSRPIIADSGRDKAEKAPKFLNKEKSSCNLLSVERLPIGSCKSPSSDRERKGSYCSL
jgi:hypothetical protein